MSFPHPRPVRAPTPALPTAVPLLRRWRGLVAVANLLVLTACSHAPPGDPAGDDAWVVRGTVILGPVIGTPPGPYGPR